MRQQLVVAWDPAGKYFEGALVGPEVATTVRGRGGCCLPADADLFEVSGVGGYMSRHWGSGWPLDAAMPRSVCPLSLYVTPEHKVLHWAVRIVADELHSGRARAEGLNTSGSVQIMSFAGRSNSFRVSVSPKTGVQKISDLGRADEQGGWIVSGTAAIHAAMEGVASFALYGSGAGVRVAWAAVSTTKS